MKVIYINPTNSHLTQGKEYNVINMGYGMIEVIGDKGVGVTNRESQFKIKTKAICKEAMHIRNLTQGKKYEVIAISRDFIRVIGDNGVETVERTYRFEII